MASSVAYCTLVTNDAYVTAALVLAKSLRDTGTRIPLAVLTTPETISPGALARLRILFDIILDVPPLGGGDDACAASNLSNLALMGRQDLAGTLTKLHLWSLTQFERVLYLDADTLVLRSLDPLLLSLPLGDFGGFAASPELGFPDCFNSGVMLLAPDADRHAALLRFAARTPSFDGGDQGLLNVFFGDGPLGQQQQQQQRRRHDALADAPAPVGQRKGSGGWASDSDEDSGVVLGAEEQGERRAGDRTSGPAQEDETPDPPTATGEDSHDAGAGGTWHRLSFTYNIELYRMYRLNMPAMFRYQDQHKVLHFIGKEKPWHFADGVVDISQDPSPYLRFYADNVARWWRVRKSLPEGADEA